MILGHPEVPHKLLLVPLSIPPESVTVELGHPQWCQSSTRPLDFPPLDKHDADWKALKLSTTSCQISNQFHFEVHQFSCPKCQFSNLIEH